MKLPLLSDSGGKASPVEAATAQVRAFCGWHIAPVVEETRKFSTFGGRSFLIPTQRLVDISRVLMNGVDVTERVVWDESGVVSLKSGVFPDATAGVEVTFRHGFDSDAVPDVAAVVEQVASRIESGRIQGSDALLQTAGPFWLRRQPRRDGQVGGSGLFNSEKETLNRYRLLGGVR